MRSMSPDPPDQPPALRERCTDEPTVRRSFLDWLARRAKRAGRAVAERGLVLWYTLRDPETPKSARAVLLGALAYLADPIDAIPDLTPLVGYTDDMALMGIALLIVVDAVKPEHHAQARARADQIFGGAEAAGPEPGD